MKAIYDDNTMALWCGTEPGAVVLGELEIRPALPDEMQRVAALLNDEHYLGAGRPVGRTLVQIVHHRERWAAMKLIDRDEWIGWIQQQRAERHGPRHGQSATRFGQWVRGHWGGCEIRNHWVRDALFADDANRSKNNNLNGNLAVLRCAVIALKARHASHLSWHTIFELSGLKPAVPYNLVCNNAFK